MKYTSAEVVADKKKRKAEWDTSNKKKEELAKKRKDGIEERNSKEKGSDEYNETNKEKVIDVSEELGETAVDGHMCAKGFTCTHKGNGAYTFDRIYEKDGKYFIVESKGGGSSLGGKKSMNDSGEEIFAQQGTREYMEKTIADLRKKDKKLAATLQDALDEGNVKYLQGRQKINTDGSLGDFEMKEFDIE